MVLLRRVRRGCELRGCCERIDPPGHGISAAAIGQLPFPISYNFILQRPAQQSPPSQLRAASAQKGLHAHNSARRPKNYPPPSTDKLCRSTVRSAVTTTAWPDPAISFTYSPVDFACPAPATMPSVESTPKVSRAGITTSSTGERHIPASVRPDGTLRKEIRVRPGYRPPEDVELYKNRTAEGFRNRGKAGVPGAETLKADEDPAKTSAAANKNAKRREARKKAAAEKEDDNSVEPPKAVEPVEPPKPVDPEAEKEKEAKKLVKKLRQARELKDKKEKGEGLLPEQFQKVVKINELVNQLEKLGFDAQGEKKPAET